MKAKHLRRLPGLISLLLLLTISCKDQKLAFVQQQDLVPWCIVAYDSLARSPEERIDMLRDMGFSKYAYDWRDRHLEQTFEELQLAAENGIEVVAVWIWLNAKRDSVGGLSAANERLIALVDSAELQTTLWFSMSENYYRGLDHEASFELSRDMTTYLASRARDISCRVALYNHGGWFGDPYNEIEVVRALPEFDLSLVYNFHHGHHMVSEFPALLEAMLPYLSMVNLNGMEPGGEKILPIGSGTEEADMIRTLRESSYSGPLGILGHIEDADVRLVLEQNLEGLMKIMEQ